MITKLIGEHHTTWPQLLGPVSLAYNSTVHTATGFCPHELFYSFAPSCPLDATVSTLQNGDCTLEKTLVIVKISITVGQLQLQL